MGGRPARGPAPGHPPGDPPLPARARRRAGLRALHRSRECPPVSPDPASREPPVFFVFLGVVLADLGFLVSWLVLGLRLHETAAADPSLIERHQIGGLMVCILTVFAHS